MAELRPRTTDTARVEAFSDGVFAIALTLLVLDLQVPSRDFVRELLQDWTAYIAYLASFLTIASIWLTHHELFSRVRRADPAVRVVNLVVLLGVSLVPWPTSLILAAVRIDARTAAPVDEVAAIMVYTAVSIVVSVGIVALQVLLVRRPQLLEGPGDLRWVRRNLSYSLATFGVVLVSAASAFVLPLVSLSLFAAVPAVFLVLSARTREQAEPDGTEDEPQVAAAG